MQDTSGPHNLLIGNQISSPRRETIESRIAPGGNPVRQGGEHAHARALCRFSITGPAITRAGRRGTGRIRVNPSW